MKKETDLTVLSIGSVDEYIKWIIKRYSSLKRNAFYETQRVFFRGQSNQEYPLLPSLARKLKENKDETFMRFEGEMINKARLQNPQEFNNDIYPINMLARMQHYGLPTRLLDITENALVALYFACKGDYKYDGAVYCFVKEQKEIQTAFSFCPNMIASFYEFSKMSSVTMDQFWEIIRYKSFIPGKEKDTDLENIKSVLLDDLSKPLFVLPEMLTEREKRQHAAFLIFPNQIDSNDAFLNEIVEFKELIDRKIMIPKTAKRKILNQLSLLGINEEFLFPEIDKKCMAIKEQTKNLIDEELHNDNEELRD